MNGHGLKGLCLLGLGAGGMLIAAGLINLPVQVAAAPSVTAPSVITRTWTTINTSNSGLPSNFITGIAQDLDGSMWFATYGSGTARLQGNTWTVFNTSNSGLSSNTLHNVAVDKSGNKWFTTMFSELVTHKHNNQ